MGWQPDPANGGSLTPTNAAGIVADGHTDNTTILTTLFAALTTVGKITLPAGSIIYSSPIPIPVGINSVVIQGMGELTKMIGPGFQYLGTPNTANDQGLTLRDLWLCGDNNTDFERGLDLLALSNVVLDGVKITGYSHQVVADQVQNLDIRKGCILTARTGTVRTDTCDTTSGSSTIADASIALTDRGKPVTGTGIPSMCFVGAVTAATSFTLVNEYGVAVNATASNTGVSLTIGGGTIGGLWLPYSTDAHGTAYGVGSPYYTSVDPNGTITTNIVRCSASFVWSANPTGYPIVDDAGLQHDYRGSQVSYGRSCARLCGGNSISIGQADWEFMTGASILTAAATQKGTAYQKVSTLALEPGNYLGSVARTDAACATTSGSATVTDAACVASDVGNPVSGTGIPASTYVGTVTPGVSFTLVDASGATPVNATATNNPVSLRIGNGQIDCAHLDTLIMEGQALSQPFQAVVKYVQGLVSLYGKGNVNNGSGNVLYDAVLKTSSGGNQWTVDRTGTATLRGGDLSVFDLILAGSSANISFSGSTGTHIYSGTGAPGSGLGTNGDFYFRKDGTSGTSTLLYFKASGSWTGIL